MDAGVTLQVDQHEDERTPEPLGAPPLVVQKVAEGMLVVRATRGVGVSEPARRSHLVVPGDAGLNEGLRTLRLWDTHDGRYLQIPSASRSPDAAV